MGNEREAPSREMPSWMEPAATKLDNAIDGTADEACTNDKDDPCARTKAVVTASFGSMQHFAMIELGKLKSDLAKADKPTWTEFLLDKLLEVSLTVGGERVGEYLAEKLFVKGAKTLGALLKKSCEESAPAGVTMGMAALGPSADPDPEAFITAQQLAVVAMYQDAQARFIESGQDAITTSAEAQHIKKALNAQHLTAAARHHYFASRDAYVCALAQQTLGTSDGGTHTDVSGGRHTSGHAPDPGLTALGIDRGVLEVDILLHDDVEREPGVYRALLNGVNETIRKQYEHVPLSSLSVPRQLVCSVRGDMPDFTVNVDEAGGMHLTRGSGQWLEARARAAQPSIAHLSLEEQRRVGLDLLLADLEIEELGHGGT